MLVMEGIETNANLVAHPSEFDGRQRAGHAHSYEAHGGDRHIDRESHPSRRKRSQRSPFQLGHAGALMPFVNGGFACHP